MRELLRSISMLGAPNGKGRLEMISGGSSRIAAIGSLWLALLATPAGGAVPDPVVTGPIASTATPGDPSHDYIFFASNLDLAAHGYVEEEYFLSGTASRYNSPPPHPWGMCYGTQTTTGNVVAINLPYKTRIVVRRPSSAAAFNGIVVVEWLNVTNLADMDQTWFQIHEHLMRSGYTWVGVSAQRLGVNQLRTWSPTRYGTLDVSRRDAFGSERITDDGLAFDVFSQAAQAIRAPVGIDPLGGLRPLLVIATGHSQSAACLASYANAIQPLAQEFDAFALHGSLGDPIREDVEVPVWKVLAESDLNIFNEAQVRRPDDALFSSWEVAGTSHADQQTYAMRVPLERRDLGAASEDSWSCDVMPPGSAVPFHYVMAAGLELLVRWVREGTPMPSGAPLDTVSIFPTVELARDGAGNVLGGIRLSQMQVPTAVHTGTNAGPDSCNRQGYSRDFDAPTLAALYPTHTAYVSAVSEAIDRNVADGFLLPEDAQQTLEAAQQSSIGARQACENGIDDDGDGSIDFDGGVSANHGVALGPPDPGCAFSYATFENPQCDNGIDDDGNGLVDFADPKCSSKRWPYWEKAPTCGIGAELSIVLPFLTWIRRVRGRTRRGPTDRFFAVPR